MAKGQRRNHSESRGCNSDATPSTARFVCGEGSKQPSSTSSGVCGRRIACRSKLAGSSLRGDAQEHTSISHRDHVYENPKMDALNSDWHVIKNYVVRG